MSNEYDLTQLRSFGKDVFISGKVEIRRPHLVVIESYVAIDTGFYATTSIEIKNYCHIGPNVTVIGGERGELAVGNFTSIGAGSVLVCVSDTFSGDQTESSGVWR